MTPGSNSPVHVIDREQVWMPLRGASEFTVDGETALVGGGEALAVPRGATRQFRVGDAGILEAEVIVDGRGRAGDAPRQRCPAVAAMGAVRAAGADADPVVHLCAVSRVSLASRHLVIWLRQSLFAQMPA